MSDALIERLREDMAELRGQIAAQAAEIARLRGERPGLWEAGRNAAAGLFHAEQVRVWADEILSDLALSAGFEVKTYDDKVSAFCAVHEALTEVANMISSLAPEAQP